MPLSQLYGIQQSVPQILGEQMPARTPADYEAVLSRLRGTAALVDQTIASMKEGLRRGVTPPKITLRNVVAQTNAILGEDPATSPFLGAFRRIPETVPADRREALKAEAAQLLKAQALPAFRRLRDFLASEYVPNCRDSLAAGALPDGQDWYAYRVAQSTTTRLTPKQIHEIGLVEVKQIRTEMERLMRDTGFAGDLAAFFEFLRADPRFFFSRPEDLLAGYREIAKRTDPEVIKLFGRMPRLPYGVVPMPAATKPTAKAGRSTPRRSATTWASTRIPTRASGRSTIRYGGRCGSWSTPAFTHSAGAVRRRSTTSRRTPPSPSERSSSRSIAIS